jgi:glycosyltransferase involved in cell wall biosynthesis
MRIGFSIASIERGQGGINQDIVSLMRALAVHAGPHQFAAFVLEHDLPAFSFVRNQIQLVPVAEHFRQPIRNILWHQMVLPRLARELQLEVLHIPNIHRLPWRRPCPLVTTIQDPEQIRPRQSGMHPTALFERLMTQWLAKRQIEVIATSEAAGGELASQLGIPSRHISVVYAGVDHNRFFPAFTDSAKLPAEQGYGLSKPFFFYVAPLEHPAGNHLRLIEAFEGFKSTILSPWQLVLAGPDSTGAEIIRDAIAKSRFAADIRCLGSVAEFDLPELYRAASVAIHPALGDGLGTVPLQAMACGCPVISSNRGALKEILGRAAAIVDPENSAEMTNHMIRMAEDPEMRAHWSIAGLARAKCFHWQKTVAGIFEVYSQAAADSKVARNVFALAH